MKKIILAFLLIFPLSTNALFDNIFEPPKNPEPEARNYDYYDYLYSKEKGIPLRLDYTIPSWMNVQKTNKKLWIECTKVDKINTFIINVFTPNGYLMGVYDDKRKNKKSYYFRDDYRRYVKDGTGKSYYVHSCDFSPINNYLDK